MKKLLGFKVLFFFTSISFFSFAEDRDVEAISKTLGHFIKEEIDRANFKINIKTVIEGISQAAEGATPPLSKEEYDMLVTKMEERYKKEKERDNLQFANNFFLENKKDKNVIELVDKKLQYQVISEGTGEKVNNLHTPVLNIKGFLPDNTLFLPQQELVASLNDLPEGLKLAIVGMKENEKRKIYIHPDYTNTIFSLPSPRSLLIYEVEVIKNDKSKIFSPNIAETSKVIR